MPASSVELGRSLTNSVAIRPKVLFTYWGRRGALPRFALQLAKQLVDHPRFDAALSISRENVNFSDIEKLSLPLLAIDTFRSELGAVTNIWRIPGLRAVIKDWLLITKTTAVIDLMPHVWSPLLAPAVKAAGALYVPVIHDADPHPGDRTAFAKRWIDRTIDYADSVLTLSGAVAGRLEGRGLVPRSKIRVLFHPDLTYTDYIHREPPQAGGPFRILFMGRIVAYKGLPLLLDAVEILRENGMAVEIGVFGEGPLAQHEDRLRALGAEIVNRWLSDQEFGAILARFHVMVLSHTEASQSGVAAAALGAGLPIVATPVGGLLEQILDGRTGVLALRADGGALAEALEDLLLNPILYRSICEHINATREQRSMRRFANECVAHVASDQR